MSKLKPVTPGELLLEEFLKPMGITQYRLAKQVGVPAQQERPDQLLRSDRRSAERRVNCLEIRRQRRQRFIGEMADLAQRLILGDTRFVRHVGKQTFMSGVGALPRIGSKFFRVPSPH